MGYSGRHCTALAAGRDDGFDAPMLSGSGWALDKGPLSSPGLAKNLDEIPPTDNSGFDQAGGFGWSNSEQGYDHISRRMRQKQEQQILKMAEQEKAQKEAIIQQVTERRAARIVPTLEDPPQAALDYLLSTVTDDLAFEIARIRPLLNPAFDAHVQQLMEAERMREEATDAAGEERPVTMLRNYEVLRKIIDITFRNIDAAASFLAAPKDRLMKLLSSKDKKAMVLQMVGDNEIDDDLLVLLKTNQADAQVAGATEVAEFLGKLHDMCQRFANLSK